MKTRFRCKLSDSIPGEFRDFLFSDYDTPDDCLRVAKAFRSKAEALVYKMRAMNNKDAKDWLALNDFHCHGSSKQIRASTMCAAFYTRNNKGFEAEFEKEIKCIRQESVMLQNIKKHPEMEKYIRVEELKFVAEIELSNKGKQLIKIMQTFTDINAAINWVQATLRAEAGKGFGCGMAYVEKALQTHKGVQNAFDQTLIDTPEKKMIMKSTSIESMVDVGNASTIDMTPTFFTSTLRPEKPQLHPVSNVLFHRKHLSSIRLHFFKDRFHI